jgi:WD40 repeat protein
MPTTASLAVKDIEISPSGKLLAVAGTAGLEVFHFNGSNPITPYTGLLENDEIDQCLWDNANHLYAISSKSNLLFVFTVTPTSYYQAPGSPYVIGPVTGTQVIVLPIR